MQMIPSVQTQTLKKKYIFSFGFHVFLNFILWRSIQKKSPYVNKQTDFSALYEVYHPMRHVYPIKERRVETQE